MVGTGGTVRNLAKIHMRSVGHPIARVDGYVSLGVVGSAAVVALGLNIGDPLVGLAITAVILRVTWQAWRTIRHDQHHDST